MKRVLMKHYLCAVLTASTLLVTGCSAKHYTQVTEEGLSLYVKIKNVREVLFASSVDHYRYHPATIVREGVWKVTIQTQEEFDYFYIVDGVVTLPDCRLRIKDDFGSQNCLYVSTM